MSSRKEDTSVKERQQALQNLDLAYAKYREITRNLEEGLKVDLPFIDPTSPAFMFRQFYNDMANILMRFKEACRIWSNARSQEAQ